MANPPEEREGVQPCWEVLRTEQIGQFLWKHKWLRIPLIGPEREASWEVLRTQQSAPRTLQAAALSPGAVMGIHSLKCA